MCGTLGAVVWTLGLHRVGGGCTTWNDCLSSLMADLRFSEAAWPSNCICIRAARPSASIRCSSCRFASCMMESCDNMAANPSRVTLEEVGDGGERGDMDILGAGRGGVSLAGGISKSFAVYLLTWSGVVCTGRKASYDSSSEASS